MHADHRLSDVKTVAALKPTGKIPLKNKKKSPRNNVFNASQSFLTHHN